MNKLILISVLSLLSCVGLSTSYMYDLGSFGNYGYGGDFGYTGLSTFNGNGGGIGAGSGSIAQIMYLFIFFIVIQSVFKGKGKLLDFN